MWALILLAFLGSTLAVPPKVGRVIGGSNTTIETYPYVTNLQYAVFGNFWTHFCGGSLLTPVSILTAGHCVSGDSPHLWRAVLGTSQKSTGGTIHAVNRLIVHPDYDVNSIMDADVAVVRLLTRAVLSPTIQTVAIASATSIVFPGLPVTAIGWGASEYNGELSEQLQHVDTYVIDQQICADRYADLKSQPNISSTFIPDITPGMACTGILEVGGKDTCDGDNGSPIVHKGNIHIVVGVTSWPYNCGHPRYPSIMTRVPYYTNWIIENASS